MTTLRDEIDAMAEWFGVAPAQVWRDHFVSHILAAISRTVTTEDVTFFGGTALSRTHLPDVRLSEDIDLITPGQRSEVAADIERAARRLRRTHGTVEFDPPLTHAAEASPSVIRTDGGLLVQVQLLRQEGYPNWPTEVMTIAQRYSDAPPTRLRVPTAAAFAAAKLTAWLDRGASRDLYDLYAMAIRGLITKESFELFTRFSSLCCLPGRWAWSRLPSEQRWHDELAHQLRLAVGPEEAAHAAEAAWSAAAR
ncbi:MAG TPA: nucleotidyl transferase AbiEii/AbiGii toxin family protein [Ruania sp.]|nr:nucleotidyl transferase AbiEii/AbiGii toxin family protein [Ruania sp.]